MCNPIPQVNSELCNLCGLCVEACTCHAVEMGEQGPVFRCADDDTVQCVDELRCHCLCEEVCPTGAIECSYEIVVEERQGKSSPACISDQRLDSRSQES
jgi:formate hydrogenlyase subunit 6/NADH:ubiquinone oxidoreductase subunit I